MGLLTLKVVALVATAALTSPTSCDIVTGASCLWGRGCDCDHDGYVGDKKKVAKYCHLDKCPMDGNDFDAAVLGVPSKHNADGDGWTADYDCDDNDPCISGDCTNICDVAPPPDGGGSGNADGGGSGNADGSGSGNADGGGSGNADGGGSGNADGDGSGTQPSPTGDIDNDGDSVPQGLDCDDNNPHIKPASPFACCDCDVLGDPQKAAQFQCVAHPCPFGQTTEGPAAGGDDVPKPGGTDGGAGDTGEGSDKDGDLGSVDQTNPDAVTEVEDNAQMSDGPPIQLSGSPFVAGGVLEQKGAPGCSAGTNPGTVHWAVFLLLFAPLGLAVFALRCQRSGGWAIGVSLAMVLLLLGSGCAAVKPWQRETLANPCMTFGLNAYEIVLEQHMLQYREGAVGGFGGGGGGCGCN